jgi:hypothetical protein
MCHYKLNEVMVVRNKRKLWQQKENPNEDDVL